MANGHGQVAHSHQGTLDATESIIIIRTLIIRSELWSTINTTINLKIQTVCFYHHSKRAHISTVHWNSDDYIASCHSTNMHLTLLPDISAQFPLIQTIFDDEAIAINEENGNTLW